MLGTERTGYTTTKVLPISNDSGCTRVSHAVTGFRDRGDRYIFSAQHNIHSPLSSNIATKLVAHAQPSK